MPPYSKDKPFYTRMTSQHGRPILSFESSLKTDKMNFWNEEVPELLFKQVQKDQHLLIGYKDFTLIKRIQENEEEEGRRSDRASGPYKVQSSESGSWVLISICISLSVLTVLFSVCYCQEKRKVQRFLRHSTMSMNGGQTVL